MRVDEKRRTDSVNVAVRGNENSLGQIPRGTSDHWASDRTVRHTGRTGGFPGAEGTHAI